MENYIMEILATIITAVASYIGVQIKKASLRMILNF